jgi:hypothetical protein
MPFALLKKVFWTELEKKEAFRRTRTTQALLISSAWSWGKATRALITRKKYGGAA